ncbi:MAG: ABC transporter permease [Solirubrobacterales bacterium]|nr:ABC transporter permease [Solirubrobacterales bacterium]OJU94280.1 MAG: multidrug ABC transporter permease [Solirubrobacterales bacterium 67-14]
MNLFADTWHMAQRHIRALIRQPWWIAVTLVQPIIWLVLFGGLFTSMEDTPGWPAGVTFHEFIIPGVIVMTAFFSAGWGGMGMIEDINRGIIDRFLVSPAIRSSIITGALLANFLTIAIQSLIVLGLGAIMGASYPGGPLGMLILIVISGIVGFGFGAFSYGLALIIRKEESLIAMMQFLLLPLTFLAAAFIPLTLAPDWIANVAKFNPVNWAIEAGRSALIDSSPDWNLILTRTGLLLVFGALMAAFATRAFRSYQRTV